VVRQLGFRRRHDGCARLAKAVSRGAFPIRIDPPLDANEVLIYTIELTRGRNVQARIPHAIAEAALARCAHRFEPRDRRPES
jgi:hypothetical protein